MTDRPTLGEAVAKRYADKPNEPRKNSPFTAEVRALADRTAKNPGLLGILDAPTRRQVENYTAWRDSQTDDTEGTN